MFCHHVHKKARGSEKFSTLSEYKFGKKIFVTIVLPHNSQKIVFMKKMRSVCFSLLLCSQENPVFVS